MLVVSATMAVTSAMVVMLKTAITYLCSLQSANSLKCDECNHKNWHKLHLSCCCCGFLCLPQQVFAYSVFSYFSAISFGFMGNLPTLEISHDVMSVPLTITIQQIGFVPEYHLYISVSPIRFSSQVCCVVSVKPQ